MSPQQKIWTPFKRQADFLSLPDTFFEALYGGSAGGGKDLNLDTLILSESGYKTFGDIHPGDTVFDDKGRSTLVTYESETFEDHECYKLTFDCGEEIIAGAGHLWHVFDVKDRLALQRRTEEFRARRRESRPSRGTGKRPDLAERNKFYTNYSLPPEGKVLDTKTLFETQIFKNRVNYSIRTAPKINHPWKQLPLDPYLLGAWLGDGCTSAGKMSCAFSDLSILSEFDKKGFPTRYYDHSDWGVIGLQAKLKEVGVFDDKRIPNLYLTADFEDRVALLQGLMDTDGTVNDNGQAEISLNKKDLLEDVMLLITSLGDKVSIHENDSRLYGKLTGTRYRIKWVSNWKLFRLQRKLEKQKTKERSTNEWHYITNIEKVPTVPTKCIAVDSPSHLFLAGKHLIPTHNTESLLMLPIVRQFFAHPRFKALYLRRTFPELDNEVIPRSKEIYNAAGFNPYQDQKKRWTHPSGAIMQFGHCEHEKDVAKYDTSEYNLILFDEATSFTRHQYLYLTMSRCRSASQNLPAFVRAGTNPGGISHSFFRKRFVEPAKDGYVLLKERREFHGTVQELKRIFIPSKAQDNTYLMQNDPNYIARLNSLPTAERAAKLLGDWWSFSGQVFDDFRELPLPGEPSNAQHVIEPFQIPDYWPRVLSIDWGFSALTCVGWYAINPCQNQARPAKIYKYREYTAIKTKISSWAADIKRLSQGENFVDIVLDPSAFGNRGDELTIAEQFMKSSDLRARRADNDRLGGKILMQEYLRFTPRPPKFTPQTGFDLNVYEKIDRIKGPAAAKEYRELFEPEETERFLPKLQIFNTCTKTIETIPLCIYKRDVDLKTESNEEGNSEDVAEFPGDDPYDETRYGLKACQNYLDMGSVQHQHAEKLAQIIQKAETSNNMTQFYINMTNFEAQSRQQHSGIKRFHGPKKLKFANFR
jgi:hypothetical protein